jgi:hypothetical protein
VALECAVVDDDCGLRVDVAGPLRLTDIGRLRSCLLKCLAEQPAAVLVDLSAMSVPEPLALSVFVAASRQAGRWPGIPLVLCDAPFDVEELLSGGVLRSVPMFASLAIAREYVRQHGKSMPTISDEILPIAGAPRHARNVTTEACLRWDLPHLIGPASLIVSELISNVIDHAHTMATLQLTERPDCLDISVRDGSTAEPVMATGPVPIEATTGRGLVLIDSVAHGWGWLPAEGGKVVWASLAR